MPRPRVEASARPYEMQELPSFPRASGHESPRRADKFLHWPDQGTNMERIDCDVVSAIRVGRDVADEIIGSARR